MSMFWGGQFQLNHVNSAANLDTKCYMLFKEGTRVVCSQVQTLNFINRLGKHHLVLPQTIKRKSKKTLQLGQKIIGTSGSLVWIQEWLWWWEGRQVCIYIRHPHKLPQSIMQSHWVQTQPRIRVWDRSHGKQHESLPAVYLKPLFVHTIVNLFLQCHTKHKRYAHAGVLGNIFASYQKSIWQDYHFISVSTRVKWIAFGHV